MKPVRLQDVADLAGVSAKTVSRVVNREPRVSPATREKVLKVIEDLNYRPNKSAQSLAADRSLLIGLLYDNPSAAYVTALQEGVLRACDNSGYGLVIHPCDHRDPDLLKKIGTLITSTRLDGVVLSPPFTENRALLNMFEEYETSFVLVSPLDQKQSNPLVFSDDVSAAREVMQHLLDLGHRRIGFIRGLKGRSGSEMRFEGYRQALRDSGIGFDPLLVADGHFTFEAAERGARELLALDVPPTAIFASSDYMAAGALKAAIRLKISVPEELSICGFDDNPVSRHLTPTLTTVSHPVPRLAEQAGQLLITHLKKNAPAVDLTPVVAQLIVRESTARAPDETVPAT